MMQARTKDCGGCGSATNAAPETSAKAKRCECGGCGGETCGVSTVARPRFFSGQLLTDGDLQLLTDYAVTKDRLHNRYLHGDGVVCGLEVRCHPCGGGKVTVLPGVALDCCGNDIIVPCPVELDVNAMVRDLRLEQLAGYDCGDPCDEAGDPDDPERRLRRYCLYLHYCEDLAEPVAPYTTDDACGALACEASRVHEGYRFELRCATEDADRPDIWDRLRACIEDLEAASRSAENVRITSGYSRHAAVAFQKVDRGDVPIFGTSDRAIVVDGGERLEAFVQIASEKEKKGEPHVEESELRETLDLLQNTGSAIVRYDLLDAAARRNLLKEEKELGDAVDRARLAVRNASPVLERTAASAFTSSLDRSFATTTTSQALKYTDLEVAEEARRSTEALRFASNAPYSASMANELESRMNRVREWLLERIDRRGLFADCKLRELVQETRVPEGEGRDTALVNAAVELARAFLRYLIDCICAALNPPCAPCEDAGVKLACIEVEDCEVVRICNLERTFVLSGPAIRYWIPFLKSIGDAFERLCCELGRKLEHAYRPSKRDTVELSAYRSSYFQQAAPRAAFVEEEPLAGLLRLVAVSPETAASGANLGFNVGKLVADEPATGVADFARGLSATGLFEARGRVLPKREPAVDVEARVDEIDAALKERPTSKGLSNTTAFRSLKKALDEQIERNKNLEQRIAKLEEPE